MQFDKKTDSIKFCQLAVFFKSIWRLNAWTDPAQFFSITYISFLFDSLQVKLLSPWMAWFDSKVDDLNFVPKDK